MAELRNGSTVGGRPILGKEARDNYIGKIVGNKLKESLIYESGTLVTVNGSLSVHSMYVGVDSGTPNLKVSSAYNGTLWYLQARLKETTTVVPFERALTADKLTTARTISLTGDVTGSVSFDGSGNVSISTTANSSTLDGLDSSQFMRADADDTITGKISPATANRNAGMYGIYEASKIGHIWSIGTGYSIPADGTTFGTLYGLAYKHTTNTTGGTMGGGHQVVWVANGTAKASLGESGIWTSGYVISSGAITSGGGIQANGQWTDNRLTTGNKQMMNVDSTNFNKIYVGNPATALILESNTHVSSPAGISVGGQIISNTGGTNYIWQKVTIPDNYRSIRFESTTQEHISWTVDVNQNKSFEVYREPVNGFTGKALFNIDMEGRGFLSNGEILTGGQLPIYTGDIGFIQSTGFYRANNNVGLPPKSTNPDGWFYIIHMQHDESWAQQTAIEYQSNNVWSRQRINNGSWGGWQPTMVEHGSGVSSTGHYWRFSNGIQICMTRDANPANYFSYSSANLAGGTYFYTSNVWTFPASFKSGEYIYCYASGDLPVAAPETHTAFHRDHLTASVEGGVFGYDIRTSTGPRQEVWLAIGKWK